MEKKKAEPYADPRRVMQEQMSVLWGVAQEIFIPVREVAVDVWQVVRQAAIDGTKEFFVPLTGNCPRCEAEKKSHQAAGPTERDYPDW